METRFEPVFSALAGILRPYADRVVCRHDTSENLYLETRHTLPNGQPLFFAGVTAKKNYVSFHLMPVYVRPELLEGISPALKKQMQGKSCFNFKVVDGALFDELAELTRAGFDSYGQQGYVK